MSWLLMAPLARSADPPLTPDGDDARSLLRRELLHPDYHQDNLVLRLVDWLARGCSTAGLAAARETPPLTTFAAMLVGLLLVAALGWLAQPGAALAPGAGRRERAVLADEQVTSAQLRARAERALADGRPSDALVDAFRAVALRQVERDRIDDVPGATAHEVAAGPGRGVPRAGDRRHRCAGLFDLVLYGGRVATREQAVDVLGLDDRLGSADSPVARHEHGHRPRPSRPLAPPPHRARRRRGRPARGRGGAAGGRPPGDERCRSTPTTREVRAPGRWPGCSTTRGSTSAWSAAPTRSTASSSTPRPR